jgi:hypothetical protein
MPRKSGLMSGMWKRSMAKLVRHRQPKGPETDRPSLKPPRHISTLQRLRRRGLMGNLRVVVDLTERLGEERAVAEGAFLVDMRERLQAK